MYLLDTMVISEGSKGSPTKSVRAWVSEQQPVDLFLSAVTIGEIQRGIHRLEKLERRPAQRHRDWLEKTLRDYEGRILPFTLATSLIWGPLTFDVKRVDADVLIAATALEHDLTLVTRNVRHFEATGVKLFNPYE